MAYVIARPGGRFEIRESLHTDRGPRARTLAGFRFLTDEVLAAAAQRARRPFRADAVIASARRAQASVMTAAENGDGSRERFLAGSRRMAATASRSQPVGERPDPGTALIELLGFADAVAAAQPRRPFEALAFPPLAGLAVSSEHTAGAPRA